jgi:iron complex outermembrane recepter protein
MKLKKNGKSVNHTFYAAAMLPTAVLSIGLTVPAPAAHATIAQPEEIIVTARRTEEVIQNVPISMTVFNQDMLDERNVVNGADLANYTPSLSVNTRFGADQTTFAIRGFTQELRTTASVAVYFADVVAPRGGGSISSGDGAGPGAFFDLQNVQVLKGPQGTLFGRNTTGGAIQLVPQEPTSKLEGYIEQSLGSYDMHRTQGVLNVPLSDMARARFGVDMLDRDGYIKNSSGIGPDRLSDINYIAGRASLILDLADSLSNYTILSYTDSKNKGSIQGMFACNPGAPLGQLLCPATLAHQGDDFYTVESDTPNPISKLVQWQAINRTTWDISDDLTVKNNLSYANLNQVTRNSVFGSNFHLPSDGSVGNLGGQNLSFFPAGQWPGIPTNSQTTLVEELQFQGNALDTKLTWQAGLYYENSKPDGLSGSLTPSFMDCTGTLGSNPAAWTCLDPLGPLSRGLFAGGVVAGLGKVEYLNQAVYSQGTYDFTDEFRMTLGARYTVDETDGESHSILYSDFPSGIPISLVNPNPPNNGILTPGGPGNIKCVNGGATGPVTAHGCTHKMSQKSEAPTWLIDFDYLPTPDVMAYVKYSRGYRQGSVNINGPEGIQTYDPEKVDAYEIGTKTSFRGNSVTGTFNISIFYNELKDQQLQANYIPTGPGVATTAILNAGSSTIKGVEAETTLRLFEDLSFNLAYTYLETHLDSLDEPTPTVGSVISYGTPVVAAEEGGHLSFSPRHTVTTGLSYRLPLPVEIGEISVGGSYTFVGDQVSSNAEAFGTLDSHRLVNLNMGWKAIAGSSFDASLFATNVLNEEYRTYVSGLYEQAGAEFGQVGEPRMYGARLKYNFGK